MKLAKFNSDKIEYRYCLAAMKGIGGNVCRLPRAKRMLTEISSDIELMLSNNYTELIEKIPRNQRVHKFMTFYDDAYK